jgi:hypothetical protein
MSESAYGGRVEWCLGTESNCRRQPLQGCALPLSYPGLHYIRSLARLTCLHNHVLKEPSLTRWCGREDLNLHSLAATGTSSLRVYQFRHVRVVVNFQRRQNYILSLADFQPAKLDMIHQFGKEASIFVSTKESDYICESWHVVRRFQILYIHPKTATVFGFCT